MKTLSQSKDTQMLQLPLLPKFQSVDGDFSGRPLMCHFTLMHPQGPCHL